MEAKDPGLYVGVNFSEETKDNLRQFTVEHQIPNRAPAADLHTTILYSRKKVPWEVATDLNVKVTPETMSWDVFDTQGGQKCLVLKYQCPYLKRRWQEGIDKGATFDYDSYKPHITVTYNLGSEFDWKSLPKPDFDIEIVAEYADRLKEDWLTSANQNAAKHAE